MNAAIEQLKEELKRLMKNGMPASEFRSMVDLLLKAQPSHGWMQKLPEKFYKDGFTFLRVGKGYVVLKRPKKEVE